MAADSIGDHLRRARIERGMSLRSVAQTLGVSASLISQVETGKTRPSVSTLYALATHLNVSLDELLGLATDDAEPANSAPDRPHSPVATHIQRASDNPVIEMENGVRWERLAFGDGGPADALLVTYQPGASSSVEGRLMRHFGTEYAYMLEGELTLQLEFESHLLAAGDSLQFDSMRPHLFSNRGAVPAKGVWFVVGRRTQSDAPAAEPRDRDAAPASAVDVLRMISSTGD